jgi:hypothetical protein
VRSWLCRRILRNRLLACAHDSMNIVPAGHSTRSTHGGLPTECGSILLGPRRPAFGMGLVSHSQNCALRMHARVLHGLVHISWASLQKKGEALQLA